MSLKTYSSVTLTNLPVGVSDLEIMNTIFKTVVVKNNIVPSSNVISYSFDDNIFELKFTEDLSTTQKDNLDSFFTNYVYTPLQLSDTSAFDAVVSNDPLNPGDFTLISDAFNAGRYNIFVRAGVYIEMGDIVIPDRGQITGEAQSTVTIVFPTGGAIKIDALQGNPPETTGTFDILSGTNIVTGTGTQFTNLTAGNFIRIGTNYYDIASIESDTQLTIWDTIVGKDYINQPVLAHPIYSGNRLCNLIIYGGNPAVTTPAVVFRGVRNGSMMYLAIYKCGGGIDVSYSAELSFNSMVINTCFGDGVVIDHCVTASLNILNNFNNVGYGFHIKGDSENIILNSCTSETNSKTGILIDGNSNYIFATDCVVKHNKESGLIIDNSKHVSLSTVEFSGNTQNGGVVQNSKNIIVRGCFMCDNLLSGIKFISNENSDTFDCDVINNSEYGIYYENVTKSKITNNTVRKGDSVLEISGQIYITGTSANSNISNNNSESLKIDATVQKCITSLNITESAITDNSTGGINVNNLATAAV